MCTLRFSTILFACPAPILDRAHPIPAVALKEWAPALGGWEKFVNRASTTWRSLPDARKAPGSAAEWTLLIKEYPALIRRPLVVKDDGSLHQGFSDALFKRLFLAEA